MTEVVGSVETVRSADGTGISYRRTGAGPPLVLVHGAFDDARIWRDVSPILEERFTVYAVNRRGRGGSGAQGDGYAVEREYEDVAAVIAAAAGLAGEPVHLLGHSSGARYALHAALLVPNLLRSLVLYELPPLYVPPEEIMQRFEGFARAGDRESILMTFYSLAGVPAEVVAAMRGTPGWLMAVENAATFVPELRSAADYRFDPAAFSDLGVPALLLVGGQSPAFYQEVAEMVAAALPDAGISTLAGQGHEAMLDAPELFASEVTRFLADR